MKRPFIFLLTFVILSVLALAVPGPDCEIRSSCISGESPIVYISNYTSAHAELVSESPHNYSLQVCCPDPVDLTCTGSNTMFRLSNTTNAHMQLNSPMVPPADQYPEDVCINGAVSVVFGSTSPCPLDYQCVGSVSGFDNNHFYNCTDSADKKICIDNQGSICQLYWANITAASCTEGNCTVGDNVTIQAEASPNPGGCVPGQVRKLVVRGFGSMSGVNCTIDMTPSADITGMNVSITPPGAGPWVFTKNWTITSVPDNCKGQTITATLAELWGPTELLATTTNLNGSFDLRGNIIDMKCGNISIDGDTAFSKACTLTDPPQNGSCALAQCVYGNETTGDFVGCYNMGDVRDNAYSERIVCSNNGTWCPEFFEYNMTSGYCEPNLWTCDRGKKIVYPQMLTCDDTDALILYSNGGMCLSDFIPPTMEFPFISACCKKTQWDGYFFNAPMAVEIY